MTKPNDNFPPLTQGGFYFRNIKCFSVINRNKGRSEAFFKNERRNAAFFQSSQCFLEWMHAQFSFYLRNKQHAVGGQCADENGSSHSAVDQVGPGLQEDGHRNSHSRGDGDQSDNG